MNTSAAIAETKIKTHCGILSSRQDHTKGARPRKTGGDTPADGDPCVAFAQQQHRIEDAMILPI